MALLPVPSDLQSGRFDQRAPHRSVRGSTHRPIHTPHITSTWCYTTTTESTGQQHAGASLPSPPSLALRLLHCHCVVAYLLDS